MGNCLSHATNGKAQKSPNRPDRPSDAAPASNTSPPSAAAAAQKSPAPAAAAASRSAARPAPIGPVLGRPMEDIRSTYNMGKELGRGQFGVTHLCTHKATGEQFACKTIAKRKLVNKEDTEDVRREVQIMYHLLGQPNIVELKGAYEDRHSVHLVMELWAGGELFDRIIARGHYTERAATSLLGTIVQIIHMMGSVDPMGNEGNNFWMMPS